MHTYSVSQGDPEAVAGNANEFSLVAGGPLFQFLLRARLARSQLEMIHRRTVLIPALAWVPLLVITLMEGTALSGVAVPFLTDLEAYARFLIAIPILLAAELLVHNRLHVSIASFRDRGIVSGPLVPRFEQAIASAMQWRNSVKAEVVLLALVLIVGPLLWTHGLGLQANTWYARNDGNEMELSWAGVWFIYVSAPVFQFLLLRWYYRLMIWWRFLWQVSRLTLELTPLHPDRAGGIGFLSSSIRAFTPVLVAQSVVLSGIVFSRVLTGAASAMDFRAEIAMLVALLMAQIVMPLLFFVPMMLESQRGAMRRLGLLATRYARDFECKWMGAGLPKDEALLGSGDIQSLNDLAGSYEVVRGMRPVPFNAQVIFELGVCVTAPFFPLVLTVIPFADLVQRLVSMLL